MQQNCKCRLCGDKDEMINRITSECSKLVLREYKTRHDWVGKVIYWELCKKLKFDHTTKWYMHKPEYVLEIEIHKILWYFEIQIDLLIPTRRSDLVMINKKKENLLHCGLCHPGRPQCENQRKWKERQVLGLCQRTKKLWNSPQRLGKRTERVINQSTSQDQTTTLLRQSEYWEESWRPEEICFHSDSSWPSQSRAAEIPTPPTRTLHMTLNNLMVRLQ